MWPHYLYPKYILIVLLLASVFFGTSKASAEKNVLYADGSAAAGFSLKLQMPGFFCSAVLISPDIALTAAHCLRKPGLKAGEIQISFAVAGDRAKPRDPRGCYAERIALNPLWEGTVMPDASAAFDMGLVKFSCVNPPSAKPIDVNYGNSKALMSQHNAGGFVTGPIPMSVVGYGMLAVDDPNSANDATIKSFDPRLKLRKVEVKAGYGIDGDAFATLQGHGGYICYGDSGGAWFADPTDTGQLLLFGVTSRLGFGQPCTATSRAARVDTNYDWIRSAMIEVGAQIPIPARGSGASDCAGTQIIPHPEAARPYREVRVVNTCSTAIHCWSLGWTVLSSGAANQFKEEENLDPKIPVSFYLYSTNLTGRSYTTSICDRR